MARPATDVRLRILAAARAAFEADGFDATSLRAIARGARTTIGMIYYYFPTKDALWDAVIDAVYQPFVVELGAILARPAPVRARLAAIAAHVAGLAEAERAVVRLALRDALLSAERRQRLFARFAQGHIPMLFATIAAAQQRGELVEAPTAMVMFMAGVTVIGAQLVLGDLPLPGVPAGPERLEAALALLFDGIGRRG